MPKNTRFFLGRPYPQANNHGVSSCTYPLQAFHENGVRSSDLSAHRPRTSTEAPPDPTCLIPTFSFFLFFVGFSIRYQFGYNACSREALDTNNSSRWLGSYRCPLQAAQNRDVL